MKQGCSCRKEVVEDPVDSVVGRFYIGHSSILVDRQVLDVTRRAADLVEDGKAVLRAGGLLACPWLEVVEQVELQMVHDGGVDLVRIREGIRRRRCLDLIP